MAKMTGMTMLEVSLRSQINPTMTNTKPTSSHDEKPMYLSHLGAENCGFRSDMASR
jgi:hypothetical protein